MKIVLGLLALAGLGIAAWLALPAPIDARAFYAGPSPDREAGPLAPNRALEACDRISEGEIAHADKLRLDARGRIFAGDDRGRILRLDPEGDGDYALRVLAEPGGMPMELDFDPAGNLVVADHHGSHLAVTADGSVRRLGTLSDTPQGTAGLAIGRDGVLYYGAHRGTPHADPQMAVFLEMLAARQDSELRAFDPRSGRETTLVRGLFRPVGVELSQREDFVAVAEFFAYRVTRYWLTGPRAGTSDRLIENLPGMVDGLASDGRGTFYLTLAGPRPRSLDRLHARPFLKNQIAKLLPLLLSLGFVPDKGAGVVIALDESGRILRSFQDPEGRVVDTITAAEVHDGHLYLSSIANDWIARCPIP